jgi:hypothetical protein
MFDVAIDSKLRGCDVVKLRVGDVVVGGQVRQRSLIIQQKTGTPVSFGDRRDGTRKPAPLA